MEDANVDRALWELGNFAKFNVLTTRLSLTELVEFVFWEPFLTNKLGNAYVHQDTLRIPTEFANL